MIHFDFDDRYQDELVVGSAISRREGFIYSVLAHAVVVVLVSQFVGTSILLRRVEVVEEPEPRDRLDEGEFVYIQPLVELPPAPPRERPDLSDRDRQAAAPEPPAPPENSLPFSQGDTTERVDAAPEPVAPPGEPAPPQPEPEPPPPPEQLAANTPAPAPVPMPRRELPPPRPLRGVLGEAVRNLSQYTQGHRFDNPLGAGNGAGDIQFDSKGVNFGPWLRRFVEQVKRNWFVPLAAMNFRGRVVLQFYVHRDGSITDVRIVQGSAIEAFNIAAYNAIVGSNPTEPLPPEYPDENVLFTVTFYYNEQP